MAIACINMAPQHSHLLNIRQNGYQLMPPHALIITHLLLLLLLLGNLEPFSVNVTQDGCQAVKGLVKGH